MSTQTDPDAAPRTPLTRQRVLRAAVLPVAMREHTRIVVHLEQPLFGRWQPRKAPSPSPAVNGHPVAAAERPPGHVVGHLLDRRGPLHPD